MQGYSPVIQQLIDSLQCLPGIGPKSAQRMALYLLEKNRNGAKAIAGSLLEVLDKVGNCQVCRTFTEDAVCSICNSSRRDPSFLCIVETPADMLAIEKTSSFNGKYFVLLGRLSPLDGIGPEKLGLDKLENILLNNAVNEIVLATNLTVEGEATSHYITDWLKAKFPHIITSRLAHGIPMGGELEYVDGGTLAQAFNGRSLVKS